MSGLHAVNLAMEGFALGLGLVREGARVLAVATSRSPATLSPVRYRLSGGRGAAGVAVLPPVVGAGSPGPGSVWGAMHAVEPVHNTETVMKMHVQVYLSIGGVKKHP